MYFEMQGCPVENIDEYMIVEKNYSQHTVACLSKRYQPFSWILFIRPIKFSLLKMSLKDHVYAYLETTSSKITVIRRLIDI